MLRYTLLRLLLLLACAAVLWVVGLRGLWLGLVAVLLSGIVSAFALARQRDRASAALDSRLRRINERIDVAAAAEDAVEQAPQDRTQRRDPEPAQEAEHDPEQERVREEREPPAASRP